MPTKIGNGINILRPRYFLVGPTSSGHKWLHLTDFWNDNNRHKNPLFSRSSHFSFVFMRGVRRWLFFRMTRYQSYRLCRNDSDITPITPLDPSNRRRGFGQLSVMYSVSNILSWLSLPICTKIAMVHHLLDLIVYFITPIRLVLLSGEQTETDSWAMITKLNYSCMIDNVFLFAPGIHNHSID